MRYYHRPPPHGILCGAREGPPVRSLRVTSSQAFFCPHGSRRLCACCGDVVFILVFTIGENKGEDVGGVVEDDRHVALDAEGDAFGFVNDDRRADGNVGDVGTDFENRAVMGNLLGGGRNDEAGGRELFAGVEPDNESVAEGFQAGELVGVTGEVGYVGQGGMPPCIRV